MTITDTLTAVGDGIGDLFTGMGLPLMTLLILLGVAAGVIAIFAAISSVIKGRV